MPTKQKRNRLTAADVDQLANEQAFKVCNEAIDELRAELDAIDGRLDQFDNDLKALCKTVTAMGNDINRIHANLTAARHHTVEKPPLPAHMEKVAEQTFWHGDVFDHNNFKRLILQAAYHGLHDRNGNRIRWAWITSNGISAVEFMGEHPTMRDLFPYDHEDWRYVPSTEARG